jgi:uncharacterized protein (TIGR02996 family)
VFDSAFLHEILTHPDDDGPRLVYADWLDEQAEGVGGHTPPPIPPPKRARAEFIRVQIALARLAPADPRRHALAERERLLLAAYRGDWERPLARLASRFVFRRGFVEEVNVEARRFLARAGELFRQTPLRHVRLLDVGGSLTAVADHPHLARLAELTIYGNHIGEPLARHLARSPHLAGLRALRLGRNRVGNRGAEALADSPYLGALEVLDLSENEVGERGAGALAASDRLPRLRDLDLTHNDIGPHGAVGLLTSARLANLEALRLGENQAGGERFLALPPRGDRGSCLKQLDLSGNGLSAPAVEGLIDRGYLSAAERLTLNRNPLGDAGAKALAATPAVRALRVLELQGCRIEDRGVQALAGSLFLSGLTELELTNNPFGDVALQAMLDSPHLRNLTTLNYTEIGLNRRLAQALRARVAARRG